MKKTAPPIHAIAAVTWSQRNSAEPHSQPKVSSAPINLPPPGETKRARPDHDKGDGAIWVGSRHQLLAQRRRRAHGARAGRGHRAFGFAAGTPSLLARG